MSQASLASNMAAIETDGRLSYVLDFAEISYVEKETLASKHGVNSFDNLMRKSEDLKVTKIRGIGRQRQRRLHECILWYQDYKRIFKKEPSLKDELTDDTLMDFVGNNFCIPFAKGESLKHILDVLYSNNNVMHNRLADSGISTFDEIFGHRKALSEGTFGRSEAPIPLEIQKKLSQVADWFDEFNEEHYREPNIQKEFNAKVFNVFVKKYNYRYNLNVEQFVRLTKFAMQKGEDTSSVLESFRENERPDVRKQIIDYCVNEVKGNELSLIPQVLLPSDIDELLTYWVTQLINFDGEDTFLSPYVRTAGMQSGKTVTKSMFLAVSRVLGKTAVVLTKGDRESRELLWKLKDFTPEKERHLVVGKKALRKNNKNNQAEIKLVFEKGGAVVIADTKSQTEKINYNLEEHLQSKGQKFVLITDDGTFYFCIS